MHSGIRVEKTTTITRVLLQSRLNNLVLSITKTVNEENAELCVFSATSQARLNYLAELDEPLVRVQVGEARLQGEDKEEDGRDVADRGPVLVIGFQDPLGK